MVLNGTACAVAVRPVSTRLLVVKPEAMMPCATPALRAVDVIDDSRGVRLRDEAPGDGVVVSGGTQRSYAGCRVTPKPGAVYPG